MHIPYNKPYIEKQDFSNLPVSFKMYEINTTENYKNLLPHWHEEMELNFILNGTATFYLNSKPVVVSAGEILVVNCNDVHSADYSDDNLQSLTFIFNLSMLQSFSSDEADRRYIEPIINNIYTIENIISCETIEASQLDVLLTEMSYLYTNQPNAYELKIKCKLLELLSILYDYAVIKEETLDSKTDKHINEIKTVLTFIDNNYAEKLSLDELSSMINYNKDYFTKIFKKYTGVSCFDYISNVRINEAKILLQTTNLPISTISEQVGYDSQSYFILRFRKLTGVSPKTFRKNIN